MAEATLAQLDSLTRFTDHTHKCRTDASYVATETQGIKLIERLNNTHSDKAALNHKMMAVGSGITPLLHTVGIYGLLASQSCYHIFHACSLLDYIVDQW